VRGRVQAEEDPFMFEGLFQPLHLLVVLAVVLIVFGPGKLPELGESLGKSIRSFKKALEEGESPSAKKNTPHQVADDES
jgi:sec-independent protein translocase protein TatA